MTTRRQQLIERLPPRVASSLREAKHYAAVKAKHARWGFPEYRGPLFEPVHRWRQRRSPHQFPRESYAHTWLGDDAPERPIAVGEPVPRRIFMVWAGDNEIPPRRLASIEAMQEQQQSIDLVMVTPDNLSDWLVPGVDLPPEYEHLSLVHRSDVLRCYLLHHHGGGYSDIKRPTHHWGPVFDDFEATDAWLLGYTEVNRLHVPFVGGQLYDDLWRSSAQLVGYGGLIARAQTPISAEWDARVRAVLAEHAEALAAHPGNVRGDNPGYPLAWTEVLAHIVAPLTWKYQTHVVHDDRVRPVLKRYA